MQKFAKQGRHISRQKQNAVAVLTSCRTWQPIALQLRGDCNILCFVQIQLI